MTAFTAPTGGSGDYDRLDVELIPVGMQLCTFYGLVHLGTQETKNYGPKDQVSLAFEFPQVLRTFFEGQPAKPAASFNTETLSMNEKSNLRKKYIQPMLGRNLTDDEAGAFDISTLLGKHYVATMGHSADGKWANIISITPLTEQTKMMFGLQTLTVPQVNPMQFFHISQGFMSDNFKSLPNSVKDKLKQSTEGIAHLASGGTFAVSDNTAGNATNVNTGTVAKSVEMLPTATHTYEQLKGANWTDEQIVEGGHGKWKEAVAPPVPLPATPTPAPLPPPNVPAPNASPVLVMKDPTHVAADWIAQGWTEQQLVDKGYATFQ